MRSTSATLLLNAVRASVILEPPPFPWGVGYSGGRDSAILLWALVQCTDPGNLVALHVDHGWRSGEERAKEGTVVADWCSRLGVSLLSYPPPLEMASNEAEARRHRYSCFQAFLSDHPESPVFLAHHADDQAETVLMRMLKGRSWQGLAGMPARRGPFRRPFLGLRATVLAEVAEGLTVPIHQDSTNSNHQYSRNFLRHRVFPLLVERFPRAVEALNDFAEVWSQVAPPGALDPGWETDALGGVVPCRIWDGWSPLYRQSQLLAVANPFAGSSWRRRFLEELAVEGRTAPAQGGGWAWSRSGTSVRWKKIVHKPSEEYFVLANPGVEYELGSHRVSWTPGAREGAVFVTGVDPALPLIWRSAVAGMRFASLDDPDWGKQKRRHRLGSLKPERCALVVQEHKIVAALDPQTNRVLWIETGSEKLHKTGIFVKLIARSDYERR